MICQQLGRPSKKVKHRGIQGVKHSLAAEHYDDPEPVNLVSGLALSIQELVELIAELMGFQGQLVWDATQPDGQAGRRLETTRAEHVFGFRAQTDFREGLRRTQGL
jgi:GDP-L-fucose synthase